jgi:tetratricopeptide (TPR) repeat protein
MARDFWNTAPLRQHRELQVPMNPIATVLCSILGAAAATFAVFELRAPGPISAAPAGEPSSLQQEVERLRSEVEALRHAPAPQVAPADQSRTVAPVISDDMVAAALERYLSTHADKVAGKAALKGGADAAPVDVKATFAALQKSARFWDHGDLYRKAFADGKMGDLVGMFEQAAKDKPNDAQAQMDLANAYVAWLQLDPSKGPVLGMKTDQQFDKVLAIDDNNWEARFSKAVSYTFWPKFLGKDKDAIANFERLADQQDRMPVEDSQAQTYLFLGNLLEQSNPERARETWQRGLRRHPNNTELQKKLGQ